MILQQIYKVKAEQNSTMQICSVWFLRRALCRLLSALTFHHFFLARFSLPSVLDYKGFTALTQLFQTADPKLMIQTLLHD